MWRGVTRHQTPAVLVPLSPQEDLPGGGAQAGGGGGGGGRRCTGGGASLTPALTERLAPIGIFSM